MRQKRLNYRTAPSWWQRSISLSPFVSRIRFQNVVEQGKGEKEDP